MLQALGKNILLKPIYKEKKQGVLLHLGDEKPIYYEVISKGEDVKYIQVGDRVILQQYGHQERDYLGEKIITTTVEHLLAKEIGEIKKIPF